MLNHASMLFDMWTPVPSTCTKLVNDETSRIADAVPHVEDMTLDEKVGQMTLVEQLAVTEGSPHHGDDIANYFIGSVLRYSPHGF